MAKRKSLSRTAHVGNSSFKNRDLSSWNFIIFLTLAFILLVVVVSMIKGVSQDVRSRAGLTCPQVTLPRAEDCSGGWTYKRDLNGCLAFFCEPKPLVTPKAGK